MDDDERRAFGDFIEEEKLEDLCHNYTYQELRAKARIFLNPGGEWK